MNVLHWHLTDDEAFTYPNSAVPNATAYASTDIDAVVGFAAGLGIRVIPEFDTPAHVNSWNTILANSNSG